MDDTTVRLLTVLNAVNSKRPISELEGVNKERPAKLNKKKSVAIAVSENIALKSKQTSGKETSDELKGVFTVEVAEDEERNGGKLRQPVNVRDTELTKVNADSYSLHFGPEPKLLTTASQEDIEKRTWSVEKAASKFGQSFKSRPSSTLSVETGTPTVVRKLQEASSNMGTGFSIGQAFPLHAFSS